MTFRLAHHPAARTQYYGLPFGTFHQVRNGLDAVAVRAGELAPPGKTLPPPEVRRELTGHLRVDDFDVHYSVDWVQRSVLVLGVARSEGRLG
jgi:mRNA-degrading endonuclease RelE of RelBE toxin-antitoxin system